jgi:hypothetical protein
VDRLRRPLLIVALVLVGLTVACCLGAGLVLRPPPFGERVDTAMSDPDLIAQLQQADVDLDDARDELGAMPAEDPPGLAIGALALINGLLLLVLLLTALPLLIGDRATGTVQGVVSIVGGVIGLVTAIVLAFAAFAALMLMVSLFLSAPFGTLAYLAIFGGFDTGGAAIFVTTIVVLLVAAVVALVLAQQRFLASKGLVALLATALLLAVITRFLHGVVPGILASISDAFAALVVAIVSAIWALVIIIGGVVAVVRLLNPGRHGAGARLERA